MTNMRYGQSSYEHKVLVSTVPPSFQYQNEVKNLLSQPRAVSSPCAKRAGPYLIFVIFFTQAKFLENKIYTEIYTVNCQFTQ